MTYLFAGTTTYIDVPFFDAIEVSEIEFMLSDGCFEYPVTANDIEICNSSIKANITIAALDTKRYDLQLLQNGELVKTYRVTVQATAN